MSNKLTKGIILAGGLGTRLRPLTYSSSKQLLPVYDKPMIYYPLSTLMLSGIRDIMIISDPENLKRIQTLLGDGSNFGISICYGVQKKPNGIAESILIAEEFLQNDDFTLILGDNILYGNDLLGLLENNRALKDSAMIYAYQVANPSSFGVVELSVNGKPISIEEKPSTPKSSYACIGLYSYPNIAIEKTKTLNPSSRGELEITDLNKLFLATDSLNVTTLGRGYAWFDAGSEDSLLEAANFISTIQKRSLFSIGCLEEIALTQGWMTVEEISKILSTKSSSSYYEYIRNLLS